MRAQVTAQGHWEWGHSVSDSGSSWGNGDSIDDTVSVT